MSFVSLAVGGIGAGVGALAGGAKAAIAGGKESRDRQLAADTQRYSPWTGMQAAPVESANPVGDIMGGAVSGGMFGQGLAKGIGQGPAKFDTKTGASMFDPQTGKPYGQ